MDSGEAFLGEEWLLRPPAGLHVVETAVSRWWLEDGVVCSQQNGREPITVDVVRAFAGSHDIDLFHDQAEVSPSLPAPSFHIGDLSKRIASYDKLFEPAK